MKPDFRTLHFAALPTFTLTSFLSMYHSDETLQRKITIFSLLDSGKQIDGSEIICTESSGGVCSSEI